MDKNRFRGLLGGIALAFALASGVSAASFSGFGQDIPLESAARQIVPEGWTVDFGDGVQRDAPVSWSSAKDWKSALSTAVARKGYVAQFGSKSVVIAKARVASAPDAAKEDKPARAPEKPRHEARPEKPAPRAPTQRSEPAPAPVGGGGFVMTPLRQEKPAEAKAEAATKDGWKPYAGGKVSKDGDKAQAKPVGFKVGEGDNLRAVLEAWGKASGWKVIWKSDFSYPIAASATFPGDFVDATSALVKAMADARPSINVEFFRGNNVVVVSNSSADEAN